jgi:hypothetical protein
VRSPGCKAAYVSLCSNQTSAAKAAVVQTRCESNPERFMSKTNDTQVAARFP